MKKDDRHISLLQDFLNKRKMNASDLKWLFSLYNSEKGHSEIKQSLDEYWPENTEYPGEIDSLKIYSKISQAIQSDRNLSLKQSKRFYQWAAAVAAVLLLALLLSAGLFFEIRPKNSEAFAVLNEVIAPAGYLKKFQLPDGTAGWVNPGSSFTYSKNMMHEKIRDVRLWGQAYFEVEKNTENPFVLQLGDVGLKVTGTSFNASNYQDDSHIEVVLNTGQVKLYEGAYSNAENFVQMKPGQIARYKKGSKGFEIDQVNVTDYTSWTNGFLVFRDELMSKVFKQMERWYNVKIIVEDPKINNYRYTATIKNESLEKILQLVEYTSHLDCEFVKQTRNNDTKPIIRVRTQK
jgi:ferric-dicitrate binding protein FerR (iron transport regulator)